MQTFDFGANWKDYSSYYLDENRILSAVQSLELLLDRSKFKGASVLDIGCGSGLFSIAAAKMGAEEVIGIDVNPRCTEVSEKNKDRYLPNAPLVFKTLSVLDKAELETLGEFDLVYAWGSLHHTGAMWEAIRLACERVADGGTLVLAIYNQHLTSPVWRWIKFLYNRLSVFGQRVMAVIFAPVIFVAKLLVTGKNPLMKERGMSFWFDVIDWIGGYPYEYAEPAEIQGFVKALGFQECLFKSAQLPTGCNEFVFEKTIGT